MSDGRGAVLWRLLPAVRADERARAGFFLSVSALVSLAQTFGLVGCESLFLTRVGVDALPETFVLGALVTVVGMLAYAALVGRLRNDLLFVAMLLAGAVGIVAGARLAWLGSHTVLSGLLASWFLTQAVFLNHLWTFAGDYLDVLASKRLFPLMTVAASAGGVAGGFGVIALGDAAPPEALLLAWAASLCAAALVVAVWSGKLRRWGRVELVRDERGALGGMVGALRYLGRSPLSRWMVVSALGMVLALFVSQYLYSQIFVAVYPREVELAAFLGSFLLLSNALEIAIEIFATPRLIRRYGVANANLVHSFATLGAILCLAFDARLWVGALARINRETFDNSIGQPVRNLGYNALPQRFRGQMRALIEGVVVYSGMGFAGLVLVANRGVDPAYLYLAGVSMALLYLLANFQIRSHYLSSLVSGLREGKLDSDELDERLGRWDAEQVSVLWESAVRRGGSHAARSALQLAPLLAARGVLDPLRHGCADADPRVRCVCLGALVDTAGSSEPELLRVALHDPEPEVKRTALRLLGTSQSDLVADSAVAAELRRLAADGEPLVRAEAARLLGAPGLEVLLAMLASADDREVVAALRSAPANLADEVCERVADDLPNVRAAAYEAAVRLADRALLARAQPQRGLRDPDPGVRAAAVTALVELDAGEASSALVDCLGDPEHRVRSRAVSALAGLGPGVAQEVAPCLRAPSERTVLAAVEALGQMGSREAGELLRRELERCVRSAWGDLLALDGLPPSGELSARFLRVAHEDGVRRGRTLSFAILCQLEAPAVVRSIERAVRLGASRARAEALEVLSHLGSREAAAMLVLLLEDGNVAERARSLDRDLLPSSAGLGDVVDADRRALDVWIRLSAKASKLARGETQRDAMERLLLLREVPLFSSLGLEQLEAIDQLLNEEEFLDGELVMREGDPPGAMYLLVDGEVRIVKGHETSHPVELALVRAPGYFGEMSILDDQPRSATVEVCQDARVLVLHGEGFKDLVHQMPEIAFEVCKQLTVRVRTVDEERGEVERRIAELRAGSGS